MRIQLILTLIVCALLPLQALALEPDSYETEPAPREPSWSVPSPPEQAEQIEQPVQLDQPEQPDPLSTWYGWQILAAEAATFGVGVLASDHLDHGDPFSAEAFGRTNRFALAMSTGIAPTIHLANQNYRAAYASLMLRVAAPAVTAVVTPSINCLFGNFERGCYRDSAPWGYALGHAAVAIIDVALLSHNRNPRTAESQAREWYGWQILISDSLAFGTGAVLGAKAYDSEGTLTGLPSSGLIFGLLGSMLSSIPAGIIHMANGNFGRGIGSLVSRLFVLPAIVAIPGVFRDCAGAAFSSCFGDSIGIGLASQAILMSATDIVTLAWKTNKEELPILVEDSRAPIFAPFVAPSPGGALAGLAGRF